MKSFILCFAAAALIVSPAWAGEGKKSKKPTGPQVPGPVRAELNLIKDMELTDLQKQQIKDLETKYVSVFLELQEKMNNVQTAEQRQARADAMKTAKAEGKKGKEFKEAVAAAAPMTDEQKSTAKQLQQQMKQSHREMHDALLTLLTDAQKAHLPQPPQKKIKNKP